MSEAAAQTRGGTPFVLEIPTRWNDNDIYGHVNNVEYLAFFDTVINTYLITQGGLDIERGPVIGLCAESHCTYRAAFSFPETVYAHLRVGQLGRTSVRYEIDLHRADDSEPGGHGLLRARVRRSRGPAQPTETSRTAARRARGPGHLERESALRSAEAGSAGVKQRHDRRPSTPQQGNQRGRGDHLGSLTRGPLDRGEVSGRRPGGNNWDLRTSHGSFRCKDERLRRGAPRSALGEAAARPFERGSARRGAERRWHRLRSGLDAAASRNG